MWIGNGGETADAAHVGVGVAVHVDDLDVARSLAVHASVDGTALGKIKGAVGDGDAERARPEPAYFEEGEFEVSVPADFAGEGWVVHARNYAWVAEE